MDGGPALLSGDAVANAIDNHDRHRRHHERLQIGYEKITIVVLVSSGFFALIAAFAAGISAWIFNDQLEEARMERRAWVKVEPETVNGFTVLFLPPGVKPLPEADRGFVDIVFRITNVGHAPAFNVRFNIWGFVFFKGHTDMLAEQHQRCESIRRTPLDNPGRGTVIFPGDHVLDTDLSLGAHMVAGATNSDVDKALADGDGRTFPFYIYGCVDYAWENGGPTHYQTGIVYQVSHISQNAAGINTMDALSPTQSLPGNEVKLYLLPSASGQTN